MNTSTTRGFRRLTGPLTLFAVACGVLVVPGCSGPGPDADAAPRVQPVPSDENASEPPAEAPQPTPDAPGDDSEQPGDAAAELPEVTQVNTAQLAKLVDGVEGKIAVLNIWATWCPPCVHETPDLVRFYNETDRDEVAFLSLSVDGVEEITNAIPAFQKEHDISFPIYVLNERDMEGLTKALRTPFEGALPTTIVYDRTGKVVRTTLGAVTAAELQEQIEAMKQPE